MLKVSAQAVIVEPDGRSVPDPLLVGGKWGDLTGTIGHDGPFRPRTDSLMLCTASPQGYSSLGSGPADPQSGECRSRTKRPREGAIMGRGQWVWARQRGQPKPPEAEKTAITAACEKFIADVLKPRYLPRIEPTSFNYPVDIYGKWHGNKYRFIQRFRSDRPDAITPEFDAPFARLEYVGRDRFDLFYFRHTGEWYRLYQSVPLAEALKLIERDALLHPMRAIAAPDPTE